MRPRLELGLALMVALLLLVPSARAETLVLDRAVVRFVAPETGGPTAPHFVFERELAFEARLKALADRAHDRRQPYLERHVRAALERHLAETLLASSPISPQPTEGEVRRQANAARLYLLQRVGAEGLRLARAAEAIDDEVLAHVLRRQARASLYLDRMVAPMLRPSESDLIALHRQSPFRKRELAEVRADVKRWVVGQRLEAGLEAYFENVRSRVVITVLTGR